MATTSRFDYSYGSDGTTYVSLGHLEDLSDVKASWELVDITGCDATIEEEHYVPVQKLDSPVVTVNYDDSTAHVAAIADVGDGTVYYHKIVCNDNAGAAVKTITWKGRFTGFDLGNFKKSSVRQLKLTIRNTTGYTIA